MDRPRLGLTYLDGHGSSELSWKESRWSELAWIGVGLAHLSSKELVRVHIGWPELFYNEHSWAELFCVKLG